MKKTVLFLLFCIMTCKGFALVNVDSLNQIIQDKNSSSDEKLYAKIAIATALFRTQATTAIDIGRNCLNEEKVQSSDSLKATIYNILGIAQLTLGEQDSALHYYFLALKTFEKGNHKLGMAATYNNLGRYYRQRNFEKSIEFYDAAMKIYKDLQDWEGIATILNESGVAFEYKMLYDSAIARYQASLDIQKERKDSIGIAYALEFLSGSFLLKKEFEKAKQYNLEALAIRKSIQDTFGLCLNLNSLANIYLNTQAFEQSLDYAFQSQDLAKNMQYLDIFPENYRIIYLSYQGLQQYEKALEAVNLYNLYKDSVFNIHKTKQIEELSFQYETEKNKTLIAQQELGINKRNYMLMGISGLLLASFIIGVLYYRRNKLKQQNEIQKVILHQQEQATKAIIEAEEVERERIARDLHDGVGQLMSAARMNLSAFGTVLKTQDETTQEKLGHILQLVDDSCKEIRTVSHNMMPNSLIKNSLATAIRNFIDKLDKHALNVQLYTEGLDKRVDMNVESVLYRVIQECVNNVIKHAKADRLDISIVRDAQEIVTTIEDNGVGFNVKDKGKSEGIGLKNIRTRVSYLHGQVEFDAAPGRGTVVMIHIPINAE